MSEKRTVTCHRCERLAESIEADVLRIAELEAELEATRQEHRSDADTMFKAMEERDVFRGRWEKLKEKICFADIPERYQHFVLDIMRQLEAPAREEGK